MKANTVGRMAGTNYNRVAARALRRARDESGLSQGEFALALSRALRQTGRARLKQSTLSGWELGTRKVPAGALVAAAAVAGITVGRALDEQPDVNELATRVARVLEGKRVQGRRTKLSEEVRQIVKR